MSWSRGGARAGRLSMVSRVRRCRVQHEGADHATQTYPTDQRRLGAPSSPRYRHKLPLPRLSFPSSPRRLLPLQTTDKKSSIHLLHVSPTGNRRPAPRSPNEPRPRLPPPPPPSTHLSPTLRAQHILPILTLHHLPRLRLLFPSRPLTCAANSRTPASQTRSTGVEVAAQKAQATTGCPLGRLSLLPAPFSPARAIRTCCGG